jgi:hypothetical protein
MRSVFWNSTTAETMSFDRSSAAQMAYERHQRTSPEALWVPAGVMWQSEAPLNPGRHPQRLTTKAQTTLLLSQKTAERVQAPAFWL